jgi:hypothetical protein
LAGGFERIFELMGAASAEQQIYAMSLAVTAFNAHPANTQARTAQLAFVVVLV